MKNQENFIKTRQINTYSESHLGKDRGEIYESKLFSGPSYGNAVWQLEKHILDKIIKDKNNFDYLDFACGTGRVVEYLESRFANSYGIDVSSDMLQTAEKKLKKTKLILGDVLKGDFPELENKFDVITSFRFFLNAEEELKKGVIKKLEKMLRPSGLLIFNIHQHRFSFNYLTEKTGIFLRNETDTGSNWMTLKDIRNLVAQGGLKISELYSYAVLPRFLYRYLPHKIWFFVEKILISRKIIIGSHLIIVASLRPLPGRIGSLNVFNFMSQENNQIISLEKATAKDIDQYLAIEKSVIGPKTYSGITDEDEAKKEFQTNQVYFIKKDSKIVGTIQYEMKSPDHAYLSGLAIDPHFQGQGIGREASKLILNKLNDMKRINVITHPDNTVALKLYQSLGFIIESRKENYYGDGEPRLVLSLNNSPYRDP